MPALAVGQHLVSLDAEGLGEGRQLAAATELGVVGANSWFLYDGDLNLLHAVIKDQTNTLNGDGAIPEGAYLLVYGEPLASIQVVLD